jgi:GTPase SAR1 family protein
MMQPSGGDNNTGAPTGMKLPPVVERIAKQTEDHKAPICVLVVGMAGSGKTTLLSALQQSTVKSVGEEEEQEQETTTTTQSSSNENDGEEDQKPAAQSSASSSSTKDMPAYCINLDPATLNVPYNPSIDIRDTVDYKVGALNLDGVEQSSRGRFH